MLSVPLPPAILDRVHNVPPGANLADESDLDFRTNLPTDLRLTVISDAVGPYSWKQLSDIYMRFGRRGVLQATLADRNTRTFRTYGPDHPQYRRDLPLLF